MYIKITNGIPENYSVAQLRRDNPQVSFPETPTQACLAEWKVFPLEETPAPVVDYTKVVSAGVPGYIENRWTQFWNVRDATETELQAHYSELAAQVRQQRDRFLNQSDWTQTADAPVDKATWASYRQALRDITAQTEFPLNVSWPIKPT